MTDLNCNDFLRGQMDCKRGFYKEGQGLSYKKGWLAQDDMMKQRGESNERNKKDTLQKSV